MIQRTSRIARSKPPRKRRKGVRRGPWRSLKYRRYVASKPCLICHDPKTQAAHTELGGMSMKGPDSSCVPLCPYHHDELDGRRKMPKGIGRKEFERVYQVDLGVLAEAYYGEWLERTGKAAA